MSIVDTPQAIEHLRARLIDLGFWVESDRRGGMGGLEQIFTGVVTGTRVWVRITSDRGHWVVQLRADPMSAWIIPSVWIAYLDNREVEELSIDEQARFTGERIGEIPAVVASVAGLEARLVRTGQEYMRRRLAT